MTYTTRACQHLRDAEILSTAHPWTIVIHLVQAVVFALLAISVAIESAGHER